MATVETTNALKDIGEQALRDLYTNLTQAKQFALNQAPEFCQQIVTYGIIYHWGAVIFSVILLIAVGLFVRWLCVPKRIEDDFVQFITVIATIALLIFLFVVFVKNIDPALKATFAPKLYLVEYIAQLMK